MAVTAPGYAQTDWVRLSCADPAFSVEAPADWRLEAVPGHGARLVPPGDGPVVEVVTWPALHLPASAEKAAAEHEGVLGRAVRYRRRSAEEIATAGGAGLVVVGDAGALGVEETSIFCAYASAGTHWVLGTFAGADELPALRADVLERMMRSLRPGSAPPDEPLPEPTGPAAPADPPEAPAIAEPPGAAAPHATEAPPSGAVPPNVAEPAGPAPPGVTEPAHTATVPPEVAEAPTPATPPAGNGGAPLGPEVAPPRVVWVEYVSPSGFTLELPVDWEVRTEAGVIVAAPTVGVVGRTAGAAAGTPSMRGATSVRDGSRRLVVIWPASGPDPGAASALRAALTRAGQVELAGPAVSAGEAAGASLLTASTTAGERVAASWAWAADDGLLVALVAPAGHPDLRSGVMARIAASFRPAPWSVAGARPVERVAGDDGALTWELPTGWRARGGVADQDGDLAIDIEALAPDGEMRVAWQQPLRPSFRALTPLLVSLGWREGERYSAPETAQALLIYRRRTPEELVESILLPRHPRELQGVSTDAQPLSSAVAGLLSGEEAMGQAVVVRGTGTAGVHERLYLVATARARPPLSMTCWDGAVLRADAAAGGLADAVAVLARMVESAEVTGAANEPLRELVERARRALAGIPEALRPQGGAEGLTGVIGKRAQVGGRSWALPAGALQHWADQVANGGP